MIENTQNQVKGNAYRITILTPQLIRLEYQKSGLFQDKMTQVVDNRNFSECKFRIVEKEEQLEIITDNLQLIYDRREFSKQGLCIKLNGNLTAYHSIWRYSEDVYDMKGTARTLDFANGEVPLDHGILSRNGFTVLDDSNSFSIDEQGKLVPPIEEHTDIYFFGYGRNYLVALKDYYQLTGQTPLLPRYALGNWWSRYYSYTQSEYENLIEKFENKKIPLAIAVIDMDWHLVDIDPKYGSGWTGYTWNRELFPEYRDFLQWLHKKNLRVTLNVHPAEGVRGHEIMYKPMAKALGHDTSHEDPIDFDITDESFVKAYFEYIHHPYEEEGVDFWWLDWQQGSSSRIKGLDPLWLLNYYHYTDSCRKGKRGLILSRYAGPGSHRYPIGFSGDSVMSWETLDFQPYFTSNASNIGYSYWSHDIGGHMLGIRSEELAIRWIQFGVFSPIMRLHSSSSPFNRKEPWSYSEVTEQIMVHYLQLRHKLIPYLYTMNAKCHYEGIPLIQPMYYQYPEMEDAYHVPNEYFFGSELIVCPITKKRDSRLYLGRSSVWLPEGNYIDCMIGMVYRGGRKIFMYREIDKIPVLAKAGGIVPMAVLEGKIGDVSNPKKMDVYIYGGADGAFALYEDDGITYQYEKDAYAVINMTMDYQKGIFTISPVKGEKKVTPKRREYRLHFVGFRDCDRIEVCSNGDKKEISYQHMEATNEYVTSFYPVDSETGVEFLFVGDYRLSDNRIEERIFDLINKAEIEILTKEIIFDAIKKDTSSYVLSNLAQLNLGEDLFQALSEIILAY